MIDIHSHILPGMDDGCKTAEESATALRMCAAQGVTAVVLTPHFYAENETPDSFVNRRTAAFKVLNEHIGGESGLPELLTGAEVEYYHGISASKDIKKLKITGTNMLLLEMPFCEWSESVINEVCSLKALHGIVPVLAHIERFFKYGNGKRELEKLSESGVMFQSNAEYFLQRISSIGAMRMIKSQRIDFLGSDCHGVFVRSPKLGEAVAKISRILGLEAMNYIEENENRFMVPASMVV